ncbi:hypothetical protein [Paracoccus sp. ME4]|uniref:hypothetical protein n=1 Tax=Paracoccus sp. ME4 TaxID=3138066 RepID=UPI00398A62EB
MEGTHLYHGTSLENWEQIQVLGAVVPGAFGHQHVSLTTDKLVARYFAELAVGLQEHPGAQPVILAVSREDLLREGLIPAPFVDGIYGGGEEGCGWEMEEAVTEPIPARLFRSIGLEGCKNALARDEIIALQRNRADPSWDMSR